MKPSELYKKHYNELTKEAKKVIETSDQFFDDFVGDFKNVEDFNSFVKDNY